MVYRSDSFSGTIAQYTGATVSNVVSSLMVNTLTNFLKPGYSGIWYDDSRDWTYYPLHTDCTGLIEANGKLIRYVSNKYLS